MAKPFHIVAIGGGGGATQVLKAAQPFADRLTAIIAVTDTGRSTGLARAIGGIPAPGDLRATIAAFATDPLMSELLQHRFDGAGVPQLEGMAFGNLLIAALARLTGDFASAVAHVERMAGCAADVLPVAVADTQLCAELADRSVVTGELAVRGLGKPPIERLFLCDDAPAQPLALAAIRAADLVVLGPGSLFTTLLASLLFGGMAEALRETSGKVVYICNTTTQPGQTDGYSALDHVRRVAQALGMGALDAALLNCGRPSQATLARYAADGVSLLQPDAAEIETIAGLGVQPILRDLAEQLEEQRMLWNKQDSVRHDPTKLSAALKELAEQ
ncbi:MAG TPA: gluconeogenesis factor YvcK family protein [Roseiflexaceae bacterium]|nr:gluconeogenesis factor YvcK family protein [Roseiflexaceae bacterium]